MRPLYSRRSSELLPRPVSEEHCRNCRGSTAAIVQCWCSGETRSKYCISCFRPALATNVRRGISLSITFENSSAAPRSSPASERHLARPALASLRPSARRSQRFVAFRWCRSAALIMVETSVEKALARSASVRRVGLLAPRSSWPM